MKQKCVDRMVAPDILKIAASLFVIIIHHKVGKDSHFIAMRNLLVLIVFAICVALGIYLFTRELNNKSKPARCVFMLMLPVAAFAALIVFRKFAVAIFLIISGYLLCGSMDKCTMKEWYTKRNIIPRVLRFYFPFVFIFAVGLIYKIFVLRYEYTFLEVVARFILGGFKPGSYYITILAELVVVFPVIYAVVKRFGFGGVIICTVFTLTYDVCSTYLGMSPVAYKFLIFRFTSHIAFGIYARISEYEKCKKLNFAVFLLGVSYALLCMTFKIVEPKIFFQWQETSFITAFYLYPVICFVMNKYRDSSYSDSRISSCIKAFAGATYHIFLVQLMFYTTFGFALNDYIANYIINIPLNLTLTVIPGIVYAYYSIPFENKLISKVKNKFLKT